MSRSTSVATIVVFSNSSVRLEKGRLVVTMCAALLAAIGNHLEEQLGLMAVEAEITQFVQDQQVGLGKGPLQLAETIPSCVPQIL